MRPHRDRIQLTKTKDVYHRHHYHHRRRRRICVSACGQSAFFAAITTAGRTGAASLLLLMIIVLWNRCYMPMAGAIGNFQMASAENPAIEQQVCVRDGRGGLIWFDAFTYYEDTNEYRQANGLFICGKITVGDLTCGRGKRQRQV